MSPLLQNCTIVIPTRNRSEDLRRTVCKLIDIGLVNDHIIVLDDESDNPDATKAALVGLNNVEFLVNDTRTGQAEGRNRLIKHARTKYCLCLDDDTYFLTLGDLPRLLKEDKFCQDMGGLVFHLIRSYDGYREFPPDTPRMEVPMFIGGSAMFNRENFLKTGGFRSFICYGCEEPELAVRLWKDGYRLLFEPSVEIEHVHTAAARDHGEYHMLYCRNVILLHALNYPGIHGVPEGTLRALKRFVFIRGYKLFQLRGIYAGLIDSYRYWGRRTLLTSGQYTARRKFITDTEKKLKQLNEVQCQK